MTGQHALYVYLIGESKIMLTDLVRILEYNKILLIATRYITTCANLEPWPNWYEGEFRYYTLQFKCNKSIIGVISSQLAKSIITMN